MNSARSQWLYGGRDCNVVLASTETTMDLELSDQAWGGNIIAIVSRADDTGAITFESFTNDPLPIELLERFIAEARRRLPPTGVKWPDWD